MKSFIRHIFLLVVLLFLAACSTKKNTWTTRTVHSVNTRYNVYFNGKTSYDDALKAINEANKDDHSQIIAMYPISNHASASAGSGQLDRTIEKCRKAIKTRSLKIKPKPKARRSSKKTRNIAQQEEFNPFMPEVWLLLAKAEFHKADFLGAVGTFNYIIRHFQENEELGTTCQLWVIRSYAEMGWIYEAEDLLSKIDQKNLKGENVSLYTAVFADILLKKGQYREAIPFLEKTLEKEKNRAMKLRFTYLLAQLYQHSGDKNKAYDLYTALIKKSPPYEMDFNARISRAKLFNTDLKKTRKELFRMSRNFNNRDYLDQVYDAIAQSYLHEKDTVNTLKYLQEAVDNSTRNGMEKAMPLVLMGDLYYQQKEYVKAQPNYDEASKIIPIEHKEYPRIFKRSEVLSELVVEHNMVELQDSLQRLSAKSEAERLVSIKAYIAQLEADEKRAAEREEQMRKRQEANQDMAAQSAMVPLGAGINPQTEWYFYNPNLIRGGQTQFQQKWGRRKLEDNWRRANKNAIVFDEEKLEQIADSAVIATTDSVEGGLLQLDEQVEMGQEMLDETLDERKNPAYYLKQIPDTEEEIELSNRLWAEALYKMGLIYKDKLDEPQLAIRAFEAYNQRFSNYDLVPNSLYQLYVVHTKNEDKISSENVRNKLVREYPHHNYAKLLSDPHYFDTKKQMFLIEDSLYQVAYKAFNRSEFNTVIEQTVYFKSNFPMSSLMPKFLFLQALSLGKTSTQEIFEGSLQELLAQYPQADVSTVAKDILALMMQGKEAQQGTAGTIADKRVERLIEEQGDTLVLNFSEEKDVSHRVLLIAETSEENLYSLQFQLAIFNFSRFILKDFDLNISALSATKNVVSVFEFDTFEEAAWYVNAIGEEEEIIAIMQEIKVFPLVISEHNYGLIKAGFSVDDYLSFKKEIEKKEVEKIENSTSKKNNKK